MDLMTLYISYSHMIVCFLFFCHCLLKICYIYEYEHIRCSAINIIHADFERNEGE